MMNDTQFNTFWFYIGSDAKCYGPSNSHDMIVWLKSGYFSESLLLRTEKDDENEFHTLQEWCRICGNNIPFILPNIGSWNRQYAEYVNQPNPVQYCSSNNTPASTPVPSNDILPENAHYSVLSRLVFQNGNVGAPFSRIIPGPMPPSGPAGIFCPAGSQPPLVYPIAASTGQPINAFFGPQRIHPFVQQIDRPQTVDGVPVANSNGNHLQMCQIAMQSGTFDRSSVPSEHRSTTESTDSDQQYGVGMQKRVLDKMVDTSDAPWKTTMKDIGTSPIPPQNPSTYTQTSTLQITRSNVEHLLTEILGFNISIIDAGPNSTIINLPSTNSTRKSNPSHTHHNNNKRSNGSSNLIFPNPNEHPRLT